MNNLKRFHDADLIWHFGASNPRAVARALVEAIDAATENGSDGARDDAAVHLILDHLCFLCGLRQPMTGENYDRDLPIVQAKATEYLATRSQP